MSAKGIRITSSQPVSVYAMSYYIYLSSAFTALSTPMLGTNYCLLARPSNIEKTGYYSEFVIAGTVDNTTVWITPSATAGLYNHPGTNSYSVTLNQGDTYQINSIGMYDDVTGTRITSDKPIAVFAGDNSANVPDGMAQDVNPLVQEQLPVEQWGTNIVAMSLAGRLGDAFRVLAAYSNTLVTISGIMVTNSNGSYGGTNYGVITTNLNAGNNYETILLGLAQFQSTKPIQVAQFENGSSFDSPPNTHKGDPCEILLPPVRHWMSSYIVYAPTNSAWDFTTNYVNVIVAQSGIGATLLDGSTLASTNFTSIGGDGYYGARIPVVPGTHTINNSQPVGVQIYGLGDQDAYGYFGGWSQ